MFRCQSEWSHHIDCPAHPQVNSHRRQRGLISLSPYFYIQIVKNTMQGPHPLSLVYIDGLSESKFEYTVLYRRQFQSCSTTFPTSWLGKIWSCDLGKTRCHVCYQIRYRLSDVIKLKLHLIRKVIVLLHNPAATLFTTWWASYFPPLDLARYETGIWGKPSAV